MHLEKQFGKVISGQEWLFDHFLASGIVEALLIQEWILHILDCELNVLPYNLAKLNRLKQNLIFALDEYHKVLFSYGTAQDILKGGQEVLGIHDRYEGIVQKLDRIEKLIEVKESQQLAKRNLLPKGVRFTSAVQQTVNRTKKDNNLHSNQRSETREL